MLAIQHSTDATEPERKEKEKINEVGEGEIFRTSEICRH